MGRAVLLSSILVLPGQVLAGAPTPVLRYCADPDWPPYEVITPEGKHEGIAADLLGLMASRAGIKLELVRTATWKESLTAASDGRCQALSFLNSTPAREKWLKFTSPLLIDPNVIITREDHPPVADLSTAGQTVMVLPAGTSIEERIRNDFGNVEIRVVPSEAEAFSQVSRGGADMTVRSMSVAVYTIKKDGWFNLKVAGQIPGYENRLRVGVRPDSEAVVPQLEAGIATLTANERREILNRHVSITVKSPLNWWMVAQIATAVVLLIVLLVQRNRRSTNARDRAEAALVQEQQHRAEQERILSMLAHELTRPISVLRLVVGNAQLPPDHRTYAEDAITDMDATLARCRQVDQLDQDRLSVVPAPHQASRIAAMATEISAAPERLRVTVESDAPLRTDAFLLRTILDNLLSNALKYSPADSPVLLRIATEQRGEHPGIVFTVENAPGRAGFPDGEQVFERYYRAPRASAVSGVGLGLYLVRGLAHKLGGDAAYIPDQDTVRFQVWIPL